MTKPDPVSWRPLRLEDLATVTRMAADFYRHERLDFSRQRFRRTLRRLISHPEHGLGWMIMEDDQPVGYAVVCAGFSIEYGGVTGFLDEFYIEPACRGRGIGTATLGFLHQEACRRGWVRLLLEVVRGNRRAARLYRREGFSDHGRTLLTAVPKH